MKSIILHIETSTKACSVAISKEKELLALVGSIELEYSHAEKLNVFIEEAMKEAQLKMSDLSAVAVSKGPGSFTGLRIGVSSAKGFAYALSIPLIACDTLTCIAEGFINNHSISSNDLIIPMIDARRKEVYMKVLDSNGGSLSEIEAKVIDSSSFEDDLKEGRKIHLVGDGADKFCEDFKDRPGIIIHKGIFPSASNMISSALRAYNDEAFEDIAYFEPFYLKDFIAIKPRKIF